MFHDQDIQPMDHHRVRLRDIAHSVAKTTTEIRPEHLSLLRYVGLDRGSQRSIGSVVEHWARKTPHHPALRFEDRVLTYAEFNAWANRLAASLQAAGIGSGDTVALVMENQPALLAAVVAIVKLGAAAGMVNTNQRGDVLDHSLSLIKPKAFIAGAECREAVASSHYQPAEGSMVRFWSADQQGEAPPAGWLSLDTDAADRPDSNPATTATVTAGQPCFYIYTSGTTGLPKASVMTHQRWLRAMTGIGGLALRMRSDDVLYCCLPLYHSNALSVSWGSVLAAGACLALDRKFSVSRFWDRVRHYDATAFGYIGELLRYLLNQPPSPRDREHRVRLIVGNGLRPDLWAAFEARFGITRIHEFYGASELNLAFVNVFALRQTAGFSPATYAIVEFDAVEERPVRNTKGHMRRIAPGGVGLLLSAVTPKQAFEGYTDPEASEKKLFRDVFAPGDCWFNTGDLVRDQGFRHIQFVDRVGDTFRWKGENVATTEVEAALNSHPDIEHAIVYGVEVAGTDGRAGMATITPRDGQAIDGATLGRHLATQLPAYAVPLFLRVRIAQETTGTFKYRKVELKTEGFDPTRIAEQLFVLLDRARGYEPLTVDTYARIHGGTVRL